MDPIFAGVLEFRDRGRVVRTLQLLEGEPRTLTLSEPDAGWALTLDRLWLEDDETALVLEATEPEWAQIDLPDAGLALAATAAGETLAFDGIAPVMASGPPCPISDASIFPSACAWRTSGPACVCLFSRACRPDSKRRAATGNPA